MAEVLSSVIGRAPKTYDVLIVGAGASGASLFYTLSRYSNVSSFTLLEQYPSPGSVNSNAKNNSQTLHVGEIETNYSLEKARAVYGAAMMVKRYTDSLSEEVRTSIIRPVQKMALGVGTKEVAVLERRFEELREIFPFLQRLDAQGIASVEPEVMHGRAKGEPVLALFNPEGYAVNYGLLARSFVEKSLADPRAQAFFDTRVLSVVQEHGGYLVRTSKGTFSARVVIFDTDAHSLGFAKRLGYGKEFSLIPIAGSFYFTQTKLRGKVYRVQDPRMPFAAVHGDPELTEAGKTRWGPTARFYPVLEARKLRTMIPFFTSSGFGHLSTWVSFVSILLEPVRFWYLLRNLFYDLPLVGPFFLLPQLRRIVPLIRGGEISRASGYGGMRLQRVNTTTRELLLGEGKIIGSNIIFNMSPSPGASVCLYNASRDAEQIVRFLPGYTFDKETMLRELSITSTYDGEDTSLPDSYAS